MRAKGTGKQPAKVARTEYLKVLTEVLGAPNITAVGRFPFS